MCRSITTGTSCVPIALIEAERYLGHLALEQGDFTGAERHLGNALDIADRCAAPYGIAQVQLERIALLRRTGKSEEAEDAAEAVRQISA